MELLKYTQQIQEVYEALNLIYNGDIKEDYEGAYNILKANPLTDELVPKDVLKFIVECAKIQMDVQDMLMTDKYTTRITDSRGRYTGDISAREISERPNFRHSYGLTYNQEEIQNNQDAIRWRDARRES